MPELPEVETTLRGIEPHILKQQITEIIIRNGKLRWPVPISLKKKLPGLHITELKRRGKYLLLYTEAGCLILHLGMSGSLRVNSPGQPPEKHDHIDIVFSNNKILRFRDPRRFGCLLWTSKPVEEHDLIKIMGPEPFDEAFNARYLYEKSRSRTSNIKAFIMDGKTVTGVGNIYASESLFCAGILPTRQAGKVSLPRYEKLVECIQNVLEQAISQGGTTLKDFTREDGKPGYFKQSLMVYDRADQDCLHCGSPVKHKVLNQRSTFYCTTCQK